MAGVVTSLQIIPIIVVVVVVVVTIIIVIIVTFNSLLFSATAVPHFLWI